MDLTFVGFHVAVNCALCGASNQLVPLLAARPQPEGKPKLYLCTPCIEDLGSAYAAAKRRGGLPVR